MQSCVILIHCSIFAPVALTYTNQFYRNNCFNLSYGFLSAEVMQKQAVSIINIMGQHCTNFFAHRFDSQQKSNIQLKPKIHSEYDSSFTYFLNINELQALMDQLVKDYFSNKIQLLDEDKKKCIQKLHRELSDYLQSYQRGAIKETIFFDNNKIRAKQHQHKLAYQMIKVEIQGISFVHPLQMIQVQIQSVTFFKRKGESMLEKGYLFTTDVLKKPNYFQLFYSFDANTKQMLKFTTVPQQYSLTIDLDDIKPRGNLLSLFEFDSNLKKHLLIALKIQHYNMYMEQNRINYLKQLKHQLNLLQSGSLQFETFLISYNQCRHSNSIKGSQLSIGSYYHHQLIQELPKSAQNQQENSLEISKQPLNNAGI